MTKIKYISNGIFAETPCPYGVPHTKVNSYNCHQCRFYRSTDYKAHTVLCLADCSSHLEEILNKIDVVIANNKMDEICAEDFLCEIRERIAEILDGNYKSK